MNGRRRLMATIAVGALIDDETMRLLSQVVTEHS